MPEETLSDTLYTSGKDAGAITVTLSNDLLPLLSEQLYQSPLKAIEELVVNSYDADATECRIHIPETGEADDRYVVVFDDGIGMDYEGLKNLWYVGRSNKRDDSQYKEKVNRQQIGKFGIGKLATYSIANKITYLTKTYAGIYLVTLDFRSFTPGRPDEKNKTIDLNVKRFDNVDELRENDTFLELAKLVDFNDPIRELRDDRQTWTFCLLENLKERARNLALGRLRRVIETAMPLQSDFVVTLNSQTIQSAKEDVPVVVSITADQIPEHRIAQITEATGIEWTRKNGGLFSETFPNGIFAEAKIFEKVISTGKSADLFRSHGFFIRVRNRVVNENDALFGLHQLSYQYFNRFRADVYVDDLDAYITASREGLEEAEATYHLRRVLNQLFNEARVQYDLVFEEQAKKDKHKKEHERNYVSHRLIEYPVADVLRREDTQSGESEADKGWFYISVPKGSDLNEISKTLYGQDREHYTYRFEQLGRSARIVQFHPHDALFVINENHELVEAHVGEHQSTQALLEDVVTAEALLEVYLREEGVPSHIAGDILQRRDTLLRSLAKSEVYSLRAVSRELREAASDERDLEVALVGAARALGFIAKHVSGAHEPDGVARHKDYGSARDIVLTLEAKSSASVPSLGSLDFAGLQEHMVRHQADGCLLVAPSYPGNSQEDNAAATRAEQARVSCWTVEDLARVVAAAESREINANDILEIEIGRAHV